MEEASDKMTREEIIAALIAASHDARSQSAIQSANHHNKKLADYLQHRATVLQTAAEMLREPTEPPTPWRRIQSVGAELFRHRVAGTRELIEALRDKAVDAADGSTRRVLEMAAQKLEESLRCG